MKYLCDRCRKEIDIDETLITSFAGSHCTMAEYIEKTKNNQRVWICCDECITVMPDAGHYFDEGKVNAIGLN